jgi:hypothetical protein
MMSQEELQIFLLECATIPGAIMRERVQECIAHPYTAQDVESTVTGLRVIADIIEKMPERLVCINVVAVCTKSGEPVVQEVALGDYVAQYLGLMLQIQPTVTMIAKGDYLTADPSKIH